MACFTVPLAAAGAAGAAARALGSKTHKNPFVARLGWLAEMMLGGSFLLAIEHVWHGEVCFTFPFLTAVSEGPEAVSEMLHEMATRGTAMAVCVTLVWFCIAAASIAGEKRRQAVNV